MATNPSRSGAARITAKQVEEARSTRTRRASRPRQAQGGRKPTRVSHQPPPVLVRGEVSPRMADIRKRPSSRRRYDVALSIPGAEVRLPSMPQVHLGWRLLSGMLVLVLAGMLYFLWTSPLFKVQAVEVVGAVRVTPADINSTLDLVGEPVFTVNPAQARFDLQKAFPEMAFITVEVDLPAQVVISVSERTPVLHWMEDGEEAFIDAQGVLFPVRGDATGLPVIVGDPPFETTVLDEKLPPQISVSPDLVADILALQAYAPPGASIMYEDDYGLGWNDSRGWDVFFGMSGASSGDMEMKLRVYASLVERLDREGVTPVFISLAYVHAPYYRTER